jgi:hypothetical protein
MCFRCNAPWDRYFVQDTLTGLLVCEECGMAACANTPEAFGQARPIWEINPRWPVFSGFDDLLTQVMAGGGDTLPPCRVFGFYPSRLLTAIFDLMMECE